MKISDLPSKQSERYLEALRSFEPHQQLLVKVSGSILEDEADVVELGEAISELAGQGIHALIIHGGGPQLSHVIEQTGNKPRFIDGIRYTDQFTLELAETTFNTLTQKLIESFKRNSIDAVSIPSTKLFKAKRQPEFGYSSSEIEAIDIDTIVKTLKQHSILVLNSLASDFDTGKTLNINSDTIFRALAAKIRPHRMVNLTPTGGVLKASPNNQTPELISGLDIRDVDNLISEGVVSGGMALKLRELAQILDDLEIGSAVSITKPADTLIELLTDQGAGTFVGKGPKIIETSNLSEIMPDLTRLIKKAFHGTLPEGYEKQPVEKIYFTADHLAFGVVTKLSDGTPYLDKLAVSPQLQGRGIGESLWYKITSDWPVLMWRSHVTNRYASWYHRHADIMKRHGEWILFGRGVEFSALESKAEEIIAIPVMH
ncbi:MAG TPA: hypothetical protein VLF79_01185 [Candidatus Saccharimonadales bacterium]|nr:hypothetical protein [Candidatus Saccharimonadales bacterium]